MSILIAFVIGLALGIVFHTPLKTLSLRALEKFRAWRHNSTRQP